MPELQIVRPDFVTFSCARKLPNLVKFRGLQFERPGFVFILGALKLICFNYHWLIAVRFRSALVQVFASGCFVSVLSRWHVSVHSLLRPRFSYLCDGTLTISLVVRFCVFLRILLALCLARDVYGL